MNIIRNKVSLFNYLKCKNSNHFNFYKFSHLFKIGGITLFSFWLLNKHTKKTAKNCGIIGYIGKDPNAVDVCLEGVQILQFRGYDSTGICTLDSKGDFQVSKFASNYLGNDQSDCIKKITETL